ncbi:RrF2 family transcriptional regulator [Trichlorobacter ammonificans]|uniref:Rrf2 family transcriptional regulator n=1 Tax=Trichlorobacter ammonificans TaxID=2916410 RepID=A0ABN8HH15_9BACT|nr:Rrf2 family transcriptional regulator [Trichlorobacter ammonificans]CAH2030409.1 Rrf2 family transcriptional regulator [Trichlorobacter ammonificans]
MMELTRKGDYAIRGIIYLASQPPDKISLLSDIAAAVDVPQTFLAKIFQQFSKSGIVRSYRGTGGGFVLASTPDKVTLLEVVEAVEGPITPNRCAVGPGQCSRDGYCTVHPVWVRIQQEVRRSLAEITLKDLVQK